MNTFDQNRTGFIFIEDFMDAFIPELPDSRVDIVTELTQKLLSGGNISFTKVKNSYNPRGHPDFSSGIKADYDIREEFMEMINIFINLYNGMREVINQKNWGKFMEMLSFSYEDDMFFQLMLRGTFRLSKYFGQLSKSELADK